MAIGDIIVGIDIGTSRVSTVVGKVNNFSQIEVIAHSTAKCCGIKKCKIIDEDEVAAAISKTIQDVQAQANLQINSAYTLIPGMYVTVVQNSIVKDVKDKYAGISAKDVGLGLLQIKDIEIPEDKALIDIVPDNFVLDNGDVVVDPVGKLSSSFTVNAQVILAEKDYTKILSNVFRKASLEIDGIIPTILAQRNVVLDTNELNDNILLLDVGAGSTNYGVFEGNSFIYTNTIPLGRR